MGLLRPDQRRTSVFTLRRPGATPFNVQFPAWNVVPPVIQRQSARKHTARVRRGNGQQGAKIYGQGLNEWSTIYTFRYVPRFEASIFTTADIAGHTRLRDLRNNWLGRTDISLDIGQYEYNPVMLESFEANEEEVILYDGLVTTEWTVTMTFTADSDVRLPVWNRRVDQGQGAIGIISV